MPGHVSAVFAAYPELAPERSPLADDAAAVGMAIGTLSLDRGRTREFVRDVLAAAAEQFPTSAYLHIGGDEAFGMPDADHAAFVEFAADVVRGLDRKVVGWQEAGRADLAEGDVVQYWIEPGVMESMAESGAMTSMIPPELLAVVAETMMKAVDDVPRALARGGMILASPFTRLYLDRPHADPAADAEQEDRRARVGLPFYPGTSLREMVEWDPINATPGVEDDSRLAGIEGAVWCETVTDRDDLEFLLLPRLAGVGEKGWSTASTEWDEYAPRLAQDAPLWSRRGWTFFRADGIDWADRVG
jgi:hexosaminidase